MYSQQAMLKDKDFWGQETTSLYIVYPAGGLESLRQGFFPALPQKIL